MQQAPQPPRSTSSDAPDPGLLEQARSIDSSAAPADRPAAGAAIDRPIDWTAEARSLWSLTSGAIAVRFPSVKQVYTAEVLDRLSIAWAPVLERHNLHLGRFTIYFVAAGTTLPIIGESADAIRAELAAEQAAKKAATEASAGRSAGASTEASTV
ncbi:MAG TPA: hypothetical protein VEM38_07665 [Burkholderiales bacterium]|nr:hypothetical protein [Burkholderiales bacterium]